MRIGTHGSKAAIITFIVLFTGCVGRPHKPCLEGGQPAREVPFRGDKTCEQHKDVHGNWVNDGLYREYFSDGARALEGNYKEGEKDGTWTEWDPTGKKIRERYFVQGTEVKSRTSTEPVAPR